MNLGDITGRASARLNEFQSGPVYYPLAELTAAANEAQRFFCLLTLALEVTLPWIIPQATPLIHILPTFPDWIVGLRLTNSVGSKIRPARLEDLGALDSNWLNTPGKPQRYVSIGADLIGVYPQSATLITANWTYARAPVPLVNPGDIPEIPVEYQPVLTSYTIYRARQVEGADELEKALKYFGEFMSAAERYAAYVRSRNLGSRYDKVPIEFEKFDRSKLLRLRKDLYPARRQEIT